MRGLCSSLAAIGALFIHVAAGNAVLVGSGQFQMQANGIDVCVLGTFDNVSRDVFGTPVNLADTGSIFCVLHLVGNDLVGTCTSRPDGSVLSLNAINKRNAPPILLPAGTSEAFVSEVTAYSGSLLAAAGPLTLTLDSTDTWDGTTDPQTTIAGCPLMGTAWNFHGQVEVNAFQSAATDPGSNVTVASTASFVDPASGAERSADVTVTFDTVSGAGSTVVTATSNVAGQISGYFSVNSGGLDPIYVDVSTTAAISGPIRVCQHYSDTDGDGIVDGTTVQAADLRLLHGEGDPTMSFLFFIDRTVLPVDTIDKLVCADVPHLSPFVLAVSECPATPMSGCRSAGKSLLLLKNGADDSTDKLTWKWLKGAETSLDDLGVPTGTTNYALCVYAGTAVATVNLPAGSKWQAAGSTGFKFKDPTGIPDGAQKASLKSGAAGKSKALVKGKGTNLPDHLVGPLTLPVTAQLVNEVNNVCFESVFHSGNVIKNDAANFKAKH